MDASQDRRAVGHQMQNIEAERDVEIPVRPRRRLGPCHLERDIAAAFGLAFSRAIAIISPDRSVAMMRPTDGASLSAVVPVPHPNSKAVSSPLR